MSQSSVSCHRTTPNINSWASARSTCDKPVLASPFSRICSINPPSSACCLRSLTAISLGFSAIAINNASRSTASEYLLYYMREEFEKLVAAGKLNKQHVEALVQLTQSGYCYHRSWGFGKITTVDTVFSRFTIDFQTKAGHAMDLGFAAESLKAIDPNHILARKVSDLEGLRQMAALHHLDLIKVVLQSYGGKATIDQVQQALVPDVIRDDWKKWWEVAKRELKKDGHFQVPIKKTDPIVYQSQEVSLQDRLTAEFRATKGLKAKVASAAEALKLFAELGDKKGLGQEIVNALN